ncbi:heavy-metal-associated domain-containing protein [Staphylococcus nepalensis]|uniref:Heavy-metal-associated domain-containing protein n=1 Tax=Staphylococcus nepalensis TaxID=214473 RepID=A0ABS3L3C5_9STAP|nr:heavy metal-associated domain-containing protein [Staphylococcus nepalensis]MBO1212985.1 heavy-metal-associated domain-containing protein [Staphylococcus nepalensis]MBO1217252.1 heavy-metal-associated domain-containing protein [Staphylococcus nepalensis]MBO1228069.1 heavy-metal-associated domain-containing protein [Staphylococcus nepalensis]MBO1235964.1 heavy-metal-associated domain-containing protein [Staphylococcus nepalensis]MBO1237079.1 heavy-metal-associated domain-containing protein [
MNSQAIYIKNIKNEANKIQIESHLAQLIGVYNVSVDKDYKRVLIDFKTPANLNNLEKEIYDLGFEILY